MATKTATNIEVNHGLDIFVWASSAAAKVAIEMRNGNGGYGLAYLTVEKVDELVRALASASVEANK